MLTRAVTLLAVVGLLAALPAGASELPKLDFEFYTLPNGLQVILHKDSSTPIACMDIWYHVGSKNERPGRTGFAHLFEHMMFQGSEHQDGEYFGPLQSIGAQLNGSTNEDRTNYWEVVPSQHLERALLMEADRMGWLLPTMTEEKFQNQQDVVRNERRQSEGRPYAVLWLNMNDMFYPKGHPYDHSVIGSHEDLAAATLDDVKDFFRSYYTPNNATLAIAGDIDIEQTKKWVEEYFGEIPPGPPVVETRTWIPELTTEKRARLEDRVQLRRLYYAWHTAPAFGAGDAELELAAKILGQGTTSRLYRKLVHETKLAQDVSVSQESAQVSGTFMVTVTVAPGADADEMERVLDAELDAFRKSGPTSAELQQAKNDYEAGFIKGIQRVGSWGGKADRLNYYNHYVGTPDYMQQDLDRYLNATPATVRDAFVRWIHEGRMVFDVQPAGDYAAAPASGVDRTKLPAGGPLPEFNVPVAAKDALPNGLELRSMAQTELPLVQLQLVFRSGATSDPVDRSGLADMASSMLMEGTKKHDKFAFAGALEQLGTDMRVSSDYDYTTISVTTLKKHLDASMALLAEAILTPAFPQDEFDLRKERTLVNIRREKENPMTTISKVGRKILFGDANPYSRRSSGTAETVGAITLDDARDFAKTHFTPGNAVLIAVGDITPAEVKAAAEKYLGAWSGAAPARPAFAPIPERTETAVYLVDKPGDTQSTIGIFEAGVARNNPDWPKIYVANRILGGFFSSRLNMNLREDKGYTYGVRTSFSENVEPGYFSAGGRVQTEVTGPALVEFMKELKGIAGARPVDQKELDFARNSIVLAYPGEFETNGEIARSLVDQIVYGLPDDELSAYPKQMEAVTVADVNAAGKEYIHPDRMAIVVVGDLSKIEEPIRQLKLGPVTVLNSEGVPAEKAEMPAGGSTGTGARK